MFLDPRYQLRLEPERPPEWGKWLDDFEDANLYQSGCYGEVRWGGDQLSHIALLESGKPMAMAQLRIVGVRSLKCGIGYLRWGPLCHRKGGALDPVALSLMVGCLEEEYVRRRGLFLRILPNAFAGTPRGHAFREAFAAFRDDTADPSGSRRTFLLDLGPPLDELRRKLDQKWRNSLNRSEKNGLTIVEGAGLDEFASFVTLYHEMMDRKQFETDTDIEEFGRLQQSLPDRQRMRVLICLQAGIPVAGAVVSALGDTGIYLHGATGDRGLQAKGAYLLHWRIIIWLKENGFRYYDLGGINPEKNPGVFHFKKGFSGDELNSLTQFSRCRNPLSELVARMAFVLKGRGIRHFWRRSVL